MTPAESNEYAQSINAYNARVSRAVDECILTLARAAVVIVGGVTLGLYAIGAVFGGGS